MWIPLLFLDILGYTGKYLNVYTTLIDILFILGVLFSSSLLSQNNNHVVGNDISIDDVIINKITSGKLAKHVDSVTNMCGLVSLFGLVLLTYDRIVLKGIDYSAGLRLARYQWLGSEVSTSIFGALGNMTIPFSYVCLFFGGYYFEDFKLRRKLIILLSGLGVPFLHAALNGGRMNLLVCMFYILGIFIMRRIDGKNFFPKFPKSIIVAVSIFAIYYIIKIFAESRSWSTLSVAEFTALQVDTLDGQCDRQYTSNIINYLVQILSYMYHGKWLNGYMIHLPAEERYGLYSYLPIDGILSRFGINITFLQHNPEAIHGAFINLPGSFYYDAGIIGVIVFPWVLGWILARRIYKYCYKNIRTPGSTFFTLFLILYLISAPVAPFFHFGYVSFSVIAFFLVYLYLKKICRVNYLEKRLFYEK